MHDSEVEAEIRRLLARATRHGIYTSASTRAGLPLPSIQSDFRLSLEMVDQVVQDSTPVDVSNLVRTLYVRRVDDLGLDPVAILKLRAIYLLGLDEARYLTGEERRLGLARTYRFSPQSGENAFGREAQYRNRSTDVYRAERDALLDQIANLLVASLTAPEATVVDELPARTKDSARPYRILEYEDQHVVPAHSDHRRWVMRRRRIEALRDGVTEFRQQYTVVSSLGATPIPKHVGVGQMLMERARPHAENDELGFRYDLVFTFPPLQRGQTRVLQWTVELGRDANRSGGSGVNTAQVIPSVEIGYAIIGVRFESSLEPASCWRFDDIAAGDGKLEHLATEVPIEDGYVCAEWPNPALGRASGLGWRW